jgi:diguanylate cyclase (GGDEF)-like protein/PAS domain S-box-containing protein
MAMTESGSTKPIAHDALRRQAARRLAIVTLLLAVGILLVGLNSYYSRQAREVAQKQASILEHYTAELPQIDGNWAIQAEQTRGRIEFLRLLEGGSADRWARLTSFLTAQGEYTHFSDLLILSANGEVIFRYGAVANELNGAATLAKAGWYVDPGAHELYRILATPIWLGAGGNGQLLLLRRLDNASLRAMTIPEVRLVLHAGGSPVAASHPGATAVAGVAGLLKDKQPPLIQTEMRWPGAAGQDPERAPLLIIQREFRDSFPLPEFLLRPIGAIVLAVVLVLLGLGGWLRKTVLRIESVTTALRHYRDNGTTVDAEQAMEPAHSRKDEIHEVGDALLDLMQSVDARDREQRAYLDTLALLDEAVLELDCDGQIRLASPGWQRLTRRREDAVGKALADYVHADDIDVLHQMCVAFTRREKEQGQARLRLRSEVSGQEQWVECRFVVRIDENDVVVGSRGVLRDITQTYLHEKQISHMALHDALTDLPNRVLLEDRIKVSLRMARRSERKVAVCFIDLDHFKNVNDNLGHKAGDRLLLAFSQQVRKLMREGDTLSRWGGDEFVLLLPELNSANDVREVLQKIMESFKKPVQLDDVDFVLTFSIGVTIFPEDAQEVETLLSQADRALFYAKAQGRNQACLFGEIAAKGSGRSELYLQNKLAEAVANERIQAWFQPLIDARSGECVGVEVLARWNDSEHGWVSPATFIPMAESLGLIRDLGRQIWLQALDAAQAWKEEGRKLTVAVNVSKRQLFAPYLAEQLLGQLSMRGLAPEDVVLEITESVAVLDAANTAEQLAALDQAGFRIAVDDFGTGYSSLSQLHELPADELKIDISFVRRIHEPAGRSMVRAIIQLAMALKLKTVAEGVEDEATAAILREMGADILQGYHFAKPMPRAEFSAWIEGYRNS